MHDDMLWLGYAQIVIDNDLNNKVIGLRNEGCNLANEISVKKMAEMKLKTKFHGRNMKVDPIHDKRVKLLTNILGYKVNYASRVNSIPTRFLHGAYVMVVEIRKLNLCDII